ncbi:enolase C-terminal domain-like protein [Amycolatopsis sp. EV170708-02-1]|uniref:enolase C-terminal domain-like protein n=1 Tax=Amycolatopsis sp. EV170708-02-1 TaxID=2919322 RepID=UPI001F0BE75E|nr:enolase C-terminal domain-like protein [Amycolatopsis sp. EV170708-02-1]UMP00010.1 hypothetical protein MJQ72_26255 [Amycolatopsis sp. EV170708-02-1]
MTGGDRLPNSTNVQRLTAAIRVEPRPLSRPFRFAHAAIERVDLVHLDLIGEGTVGEGEIAAGIDHGQNPIMIADEARKLSSVVARQGRLDVAGLTAVLRENEIQASGPARLLVEMAYLDLLAKDAAVPVWHLLGLPPPRNIRLVRTVPLDEEFPERQRPLKVKLGGPDDERILGRLSAVPGPIILDVNRGWGRAEWLRFREAVQAIAPAVLEDPVSDEELLPEIRAALLGTAVVLDEGIEGMADVEHASTIADGANVKLMRFGGILPAAEALDTLREADATTMLGCYLEPPRAIAYAAQLAGLCDWTDLDGHFWLTDDAATSAYRLDSSRPGIPEISYTV